MRLFKAVCYRATFLYTSWLNSFMIASAPAVPNCLSPRFALICSVMEDNISVESCSINMVKTVRGSISLNIKFMYSKAGSLTFFVCLLLGRCPFPSRALDIPSDTACWNLCDSVVVCMSSRLSSSSTSSSSVSSSTALFKSSSTPVVSSTSLFKSSSTRVVNFVFDHSCGHEVIRCVRRTLVGIRETMVFIGLADGRITGPKKDWVIV